MAVSVAIKYSLTYASNNAMQFIQMNRAKNRIQLASDSEKRDGALQNQLPIKLVIDDLIKTREWYATSN